MDRTKRDLEQVAQRLWDATRGEITQGYLNHDALLAAALDEAYSLAEKDRAEYDTLHARCTWDPALLTGIDEEGNTVNLVLRSEVDRLARANEANAGMLLTSNRHLRTERDAALDRVAELERQLADEPEVIRCAGGCGEVVEEEGERCTLCEDIAKDEAAGDDDYHRTREDEP